jgi:hypothetical protein
MPRGLEITAWIGVGLLLTAVLPLFLCLPLWADVTHYDLCARNLLSGGVPYRDIADINLPGMVWVHAAVRSLVGWRSEALRAVDFFVVSALVALLIGWLRSAGASRAARAWTVLALYAFYFSLTEWCHCQRDVWMLLPALIALHLRRRQLDRLVLPNPSAALVAAWSLLEGVVWSLAIWIKPFVLLACVGCWLAATLLRKHAPRKRLWADSGGMLAGGFLAAGVGCAWLWQAGALPYLWHIFLTWNREYHAHSLSGWARTRLLYRALTPWCWIHFVAVPFAVIVVGRALTAGDRAAHERAAKIQVLLAVFYLSWLAQAVYIQQPFDYVLAPAAVIAIALMAGHNWLPELPLLRWCVMAVFAISVIYRYPLLHEGRLGLWAQCWREGSTARLRDRLRLVRGANSPGWTELEQVAQELRRRQVRDGELTCFNNSPQPLYLDLGVRPSTPFLHLGTILMFFPSHEQEIRQSLQASRQRYAVSDLLAAGLSPAQAALVNKPDALPSEFPVSLQNVFPWSEPVIFRAGRYLIHAVHGPVGPLTPGAAATARASLYPPATP